MKSIVAVIVILMLAIPNSGTAQDEQEAGCTPSGDAIRVVAEGNEFDAQCYAVDADKKFTVELVNKDSFSHNFSIYRERGGEAIFTGPYVTGDSEDTFNIKPIAEGSYYFRCDIHPTMEGDFLVGDAQQASPTGTQTSEPGGRAQAGAKVQLELVARGLTAPVFITHAPGDNERLFVVDQVGQIRVLRDKELLDEPFLDLSDKIVELREQYDERGVLGLAFHPKYETNRRFFVYYSAPLRADAPDDWNHTAHLSEFRASEGDPNKADPGSERVVLRVDQPQANHNGGHIAFGPDGMLYVPLGDGGQGNDVGIGHDKKTGNGQSLDTLLGKVLRLDVDNGEPYAVPPDNPFAGAREGKDEIFAYGFRNPYHVSFDSGGEREMFVADAGQDRFEEVSIVTRGGNYGWRIREGAHCFDPNTPSDPPEQCPDAGANGDRLIDPVIEYGREEILGSVIIGGYVYRGDSMEALQGQYIFGDYTRDRTKPDGVLFAAERRDEGLWELRELQVEIADQETEGQVGRFVLSFGEDAQRELYVGLIERGGPTGMTGAVYRFASAQGDAESQGGDSSAVDDDSSAGPWILAGILALIAIGVGVMVLRARKT